MTQNVRSMSLKGCSPKNLQAVPISVSIEILRFVLAGPPHPNALRVYLNWLLSREGQLAFSKATVVPSLRLDVPRDHLPDKGPPRDDANRPSLSKEEFVTVRREVNDFLRSLNLTR